MPMVVGVRFQNAGKMYYFDPGELNPATGDQLVVETARGLELAQAAHGVQEVSDQIVVQPLKRVIRLATDKDIQQQAINQQKEREARAICLKKIEEHRLDMKLVKVEYTFDRNKLIAYFTSSGRVDFRALVKDLASIFRVRIELKQIGVRDEAKMLGGLGACGRPLCCSQFLSNFQPVSIKMAKEQNLSLNPSKISGMCGRLMCCLKYEEEQYAKARKNLPPMGKDVITPDGQGTVVDVNILQEIVKVRIAEGNDSEVHEYAACDVQRVAAPQRQQENNASKKRGSGRGQRQQRRAARAQAAPVIHPEDEEFIETDVEIDLSDNRIDDEQ